MANEQVKGVECLQSTRGCSSRDEEQALYHIPTNTAFSSSRETNEDNTYDSRTIKQIRIDGLSTLGRELEVSSSTPRSSQIESPSRACTRTDASEYLSSLFARISSGSIETVGQEQGCQAYTTLPLLRHGLGPSIEEETEEQEGRKVLDEQDPNFAQVQVIRGPANEISDPALLKQGIPSFRHMVPTPNAYQSLHPDYKRRAHPKTFFTVGRVFHVLWSEPASAFPLPGSPQDTMSEISSNHLNEPVHSKPRRLVVIRQANYYCSALAIYTYGNQGVAKQGVTKSEHAIIYTGRRPPLANDNERPRRGEDGMQEKPIRVDANNRADLLDTMSRLNFGKIYTVEHNIKVKDFGMVNPKSMKDLTYQWRQVWMS